MNPNPCISHSKIITLTGTHGTGKTTLLQALSTFLNRHEIPHLIAPEVPRVVCEMADDPAFLHRGRNSLEKQMMLMIAQAVSEAKLAKETPLLICDRMMVDHWAYTKTLFREALINAELDDILQRTVSAHCSTYDKVFYLPIEFTLVEDGTREGDVAFQQEIDGEIQKQLDFHHVEFTTLTGTVEERLQQVIDASQIMNQNTQ